VRLRLPPVTGLLEGALLGIAGAATDTTGAPTTVAPPRRRVLLRRVLRFVLRRRLPPNIEFLQDDISKHTFDFYQSPQMPDRIT
jgi:hypothetical protein